MKRCPNCNYENNQASSYCERCGVLLSSPYENSFSEQTSASVHEAYTSPVNNPATTREQSYYSSTLPPPPPSSMQSTYSTPIDVPPPPPVPFSDYNAPPAPNYNYSFPSSFTTQPERRRRFGAVFLSSLLYLLGAGCVAFGASGFLLHEASSTLVGLVFIVLCIVALIALVLLLIFRKHLVLRWWLRVLIVFGLTIVATIAIFAAGASSPGRSEYVALGIVFVTYGLITAIIAFW